MAGDVMQNALICPLCQAVNRCASAASSADKAADCWCMALVIPPTLLAQVPSAQRNRACICATCVAAFWSDVGSEGSDI
ncbi:MAG: hypothetical protein ACI9RY_001533 [Reinekea sp.]|jgi:hypothetical protein